MNIIADRANHYGDPETNLTRIARLWSAYLDVEVSGHDVAQLMVLLKISRSRVSNVDDNYTDAVGYTEIARRLR